MSIAVSNRDAFVDIIENIEISNDTTMGTIAHRTRIAPAATLPVNATAEILAWARHAAGANGFGGF